MVSAWPSSAPRCVRGINAAREPADDDDPGTRQVARDLDTAMRPLESRPRPDNGYRAGRRACDRRDPETGGGVEISASRAGYSEIAEIDAVHASKNRPDAPDRRRRYPRAKCGNVSGHGNRRTEVFTCPL